MNRQQLVDKICDELFSLRYKSKGHDFTFNVISDDNKALVKNAISLVINDNFDRDIGTLQAKVYAYEQIIANSNFASLLIKEVER